MLLLFILHMYMLPNPLFCKEHIFFKLIYFRDGGGAREKERET